MYNSVFVEYFFLILNKPRKDYKMTLAEHRKKLKAKIENRKIRPHQKISNDFIENTITRSNLICLKIMFYLASVLENKDLKEVKDDTTLVSSEISTRQMLKYIGSNTKDIRQNLKAMQETSISFVDKGEQIVEGMSLLPYFKIEYGKDRTEVKIFKRIAEMIIGVGRNYTFLDTSKLMKVRSKHTLRMIPLLYRISQYSENVGKRKRMDLDELNEFFGTNYRSIHDIEKNILKPVIDELKGVSHLTFIYEIVTETFGEKGRPKAISVIIDLIEKQPSLFKNLLPKNEA